MIHADEEIIAGNNHHFRVIDVVPFAEERPVTCTSLLRGEVTASRVLSRKGRTRTQSLKTLVTTSAAELENTDTGGRGRSSR
jgi:hypothetical protein